MLASAAARSAAVGSAIVAEGTASVVAAIGADGTISFDCGLESVTIAGGPYTVAGAVTIDGGGLVTLSGENAHRHFVVQPDASLRLANHASDALTTSARDFRAALNVQKKAKGGQR